MTSQTSHSHLRCDVVRSAAEGARGHAFIHVLLTHAEVSNFDVALWVQHHVIELQIPAAETSLWAFMTTLILVVCCCQLSIYPERSTEKLYCTTSCLSEPFICLQHTSDAGKQTIILFLGLKSFFPLCFFLFALTIKSVVLCFMSSFSSPPHSPLLAAMSQSSVRTPNTRLLVRHAEWMGVLLSWSTEEEQGDLSLCQTFLSLLSIFASGFNSRLLPEGYPSCAVYTQRGLNLHVHV